MRSRTLAEVLHGDAARLAAALGLAPDEARREARVVLARALGTNAAYLAAHGDEPLPEPDANHYRRMLERRLAGEPVAYIVGEHEFYGLPFAVSPAVLIPRPETELLVELALERLPEHAASAVLDLGTGTGCIAVAIAASRPRAWIVATDVSAAALEVAAANVGRHAVSNVELRLGETYAAVAGERFDLIVSNPPYVADGDPHLARGDLRFEPRIALAAGADGLGVLRDLIHGASPHMTEGGWILLEHGFDQAANVRELLASAGFAQVASWPDLAGIARVAGGVKR